MVRVGGEHDGVTVNFTIKGANPDNKVPDDAVCMGEEREESFNLEFRSERAVKGHIPVDTPTGREQAVQL